MSTWHGTHCRRTSRADSCARHSVGSRSPRSEIDAGVCAAPYRRRRSRDARARGRCSCARVHRSSPDRGAAVCTCRRHTSTRDCQQRARASQRVRERYESNSSAPTPSATRRIRPLTCTLVRVLAVVRAHHLGMRLIRRECHCATQSRAADKSASQSTRSDAASGA
jgi:hypothetical protein